MQKPLQPQAPEHFHPQEVATRREMLVSVTAAAALALLFNQGHRGIRDTQPLPLPEPASPLPPEPVKIASIRRACEEIERLGIGKAQWFHPDGVTDAYPKDPFIMIAQIHPGDGKLTTEVLKGMWNGFRAFSVLQDHNVMTKVHVEAHPSTTNLSLSTIKKADRAILSREELKTLIATNMKEYEEALRAAGRHENVLRAVCSLNTVFTGIEDPLKQSGNDEKFNQWQRAYLFLLPIVELMKNHGYPLMTRDKTQKIMLFWANQYYFLEDVERAADDLIGFNIVQQDRERYLATLPNVELAYFGAAHSEAMSYLVPKETSRSLLLIRPQNTEIPIASRIEDEGVLRIASEVNRWKSQSVHVPLFRPGQFPPRLNPPLPRK